MSTVGFGLAAAAVRKEVARVVCHEAAKLGEYMQVAERHSANAVGPGMAAAG